MRGKGKLDSQANYCQAVSRTHTLSHSFSLAVSPSLFHSLLFILYAAIKYEIIKSELCARGQQQQQLQKLRREKKRNKSMRYDGESDRLCAYPVQLSKPQNP